MSNQTQNLKLKLKRNFFTLFIQVFFCVKSISRIELEKRPFETEREIVLFRFKQIKIKETLKSKTYLKLNLSRRLETTLIQI